MNQTFSGKIWVLGDDIQILLSLEYLALKTVEDMKKYVFSPLEKNLPVT